MPDKEGFEQKIAAMRVRFLARLNGTILTLESIQEHLADGTISEEEKQHLSSLAHGLSGTGGTFGYQDITHMGQLLERALDPRTKSEDAEALLLLDKLLVACIAALKDLPPAS